MSTMKKDRKKSLAFIQFSLLLAIEIIFCFTVLGTLPALGPLSATLSHVPVIVTAIILGTKAGAGMGLAFGTCSFIYWSFVSPTITSFLYTPLVSLGEYKGNFGSLLICFVPRILIGVVTALVYAGLKKLIKNEVVVCAVAGLLGSLTNTVLVLSGMALFFSDAFLSLNAAIGTSILYIIGSIVLTNGLPEAVIGALAAAFVALPVKKAVKKYMK